MSLPYEKQTFSPLPSHDDADIESRSPSIDQHWPLKPAKKSIAKKRIILLPLALLTCIALAFFTGSATTTLQQPLHQVSLRPNAAFPYRYGPVEGKLDMKAVNSTLGFQKMYLLNLPKRTDKRAEFTILAKEYGMDFEFVDGVDGAQIRANLTNMQAGILGCAEGHAKIWRKMIEDDVESALVFEDDFDFDVRIFEQIARLIDPFAAFLTIMSKNGTLPPAKASDPFRSESWDMFWWAPQTESTWPLVGEVENRPIFSYEDPTTETPEKEAEWVNKMMKQYGLEQDRKLGLASGRVRIIQPTMEVFGTTSYAVSRSGARKLLYKNAHKGGLIDHIDTTMHWMANDNLIRSYSVSPPLFSHFQSHLGNGLDSDREHTKKIPLPGKDGVSEGIAISARKTLLEKLNWNMKDHWYYNFDRKLGRIVIS